MINIKKLIKILPVIILLVIIYLSINSLSNLLVVSKSKEMKGIYISYIDYSPLKDKNEEEAKTIIDEMVNNISKMGLNTIILQVRPFADAIYKSNLYPISEKISSTNTLNLDILSYFIEKSHKLNIKVHAWINPYRISNQNITSKEKTIYNPWFGTTNIEGTSDGTFFNPASTSVLSFILDGLKELIKNYDIDGILYDDYFYPNNTIDLNSYASYKAINDYLTIEEFRYNNIINLIKESYKVIKETDSNVLFGISPQGNIENNLNEEYLDVYTLLKQKYLDYISPQIYYGFNNEVKPFIKTLNTWNDLIKEDITLIPSLALYKAGLSDTYALSGSEEWKENDNIIKNQISSAKVVSNYGGYLIYSYDYMFNNKKMNKQGLEEVKHLKEIINQ